MSTVSIKSSVNFGSIYQKAMQSQLKQIGSNLSVLRKARNEDISTVANAVDIVPGLLEQVESGRHDLQLKTLFVLCDYYGTDLARVVGKGELLNLQVV